LQPFGSNEFHNSSPLGKASLFRIILQVLQLPFQLTGKYQEVSVHELQTVCCNGETSLTRRLTNLMPNERAVATGRYGLLSGLLKTSNDNFEGFGGSGCFPTNVMQMDRGLLRFCSTKRP